MKKTESKETDPDLYVVGVGASAGGLDAITKLLSNFNGNHSDFCVVVVMHLSPKYKSELTSILNKRCNWPVITVESNLRMQARHIYVTPQNKDIHIENTELILDSLPVKYSTAPSIDNFFSSLAKARKNKAVGVILSGFGSDGSKGISEIKKYNGLTIAQFPDSAEHSDMPNSAIQTQMLDMVIPPEQMFEEISQFVSNSRAIAENPPKKKSIDAIFELLEKRSGTDFSLYKPTTIMRRINHRMAGLNISSLMEYYEKIKNSPKELDFLFDSVLIGVTEFFRDVQAFESFKKKLEVIVRQKSTGDSIRIWCVGCATGEEPYSVAILLHEILGHDVHRYQIQIFASDIDERALNFGRKGVYKKEILENLEPGLREKYFETNDGVQYEVIKEIKQHILFTRHDISNDPPFVKLDAITCRNLLIYFNNELQKQTFQIFHNALRSHGILFLGKSESIGVAADLFEKSHVNKIYKKTEASFNYQLRFSRYRAKSDSSLIEQKKKEIRNMSITDVTKETLYHKYDHPFVVINSVGDIKQVHGSLRMYLEISEGNMNASLFRMANKEMVTVLKALLAQVKKTKVPHTSQVVKFKLFDNLHYVRIKMTPLIYTIGDAQYYVVVFMKITPDESVLELQKKLETTDFVNLRIKELEDELATKSEHLQIFTEELEATNEELQTINEELQSANEELKSSNEELETSNEELQSANEELNTANNEMRIANESLINKERELKQEKKLSEKNELIYRTVAENIPNGSVGILNDKLYIEYIAGQGLDTLRAEDMIGKTMPDLNPSKLEAERIRELCYKTLSGEPGFIEVEYHNRYYEIQTVPIRIGVDKSNKIMYLTQEVTEAKRSQLKLQTALQAAKQVIFEYDFVGDQIIHHEAFPILLGLEPGKTYNADIILNHILEEDLQTIQKNYKEIIENGHFDHELRFRTREGIRHLRVIARIFYDESGKPENAIATAIDISKDKELLHRVKESEERFRIIADSAPVTIWITDKDNKCTYINDTWLEHTGSDFKDNLGQGWLQFLHPDDRQNAIDTFLEASSRKESFEVEYRVKHSGGSYSWFLNIAQPMVNKDGGFSGFIGSCTDITQQKIFSEELESKIAKRTEELKSSYDELLKLNINLEEYARVTSHDLQEPIRKIRTFNSMLRNKVNENEPAIKLVNKIETAAERITTLIKDVLEYSKVAESNVHFKKVDLDQILKEIEQDLELLISEKNVNLESGKLGSITASQTQMYQLFGNLIKNGIKFNEKDPKIGISAENVKGKDLPESFKANSRKTYRKIKFVDNGIGIDETQYKKIFQPFKRLHSKGAYEGTGIGLALCKRITEIHQGYITVEKNNKQGSTFTVYLPVHK